MADGNVVVGVFTERQQAEQALFELRQARFRDIGWILREDDDPTTQKLPALSSSEHSTVRGGLLLGALVGVVLGGSVLFFAPHIHLAGLLTVLLVFMLSGTLLGGGIGFWIRIGGEEASSLASPSSFYRIILIVQADERSELVFRIFERCQALRTSPVQDAVTEPLKQSDILERGDQATLELKALEDIP